MKIKQSFVFKFLIGCLLLLFSFTACEKNQKKAQKLEKIKIQSLITKWEYAVKSQNYKIYTKVKLNPLSKERFLTEFEDYYYQSAQVIEVKNKGEKLIDGSIYILREITLAANTVKRSDDSSEGMITGTMDVVRLDQEDSFWKVYNKTIMRNH